MKRALLFTSLLGLFLASCAAFSTPVRVPTFLAVDPPPNASARMEPAVGQASPNVVTFEQIPEPDFEEIGSAPSPILATNPPPKLPTPVHSTPNLIIAPTLQPTSSALPYPPAVARDALVDVWDDPAREGDVWSRQTQLLLGERVLMIQAREEWSEIIAVQQPSRKHPMGYPGWVRSRSLEPGWRVGELWLVVMVPQTSVYPLPSLSSEPVSRAYLDTRLPALEKSDGWTLAALPDGRNGWLPDGSLRLATDPDIPMMGNDDSIWEEDPEGFGKPLGPGQTPYPAETIMETTRLLVGAPYLWGGTTIAGFDCSGFVYRLFHAHGVTLARDAQDQASFGHPVSQAELRPGDLLFYTNRPDGRISHVGLYTGFQQLIDAELEGGLARRTILKVLATHHFISAIHPASGFNSLPPSTPALQLPMSPDR